MERKIAMSNTTNEQDRKEFSFEENFIDETIIADKSSKTKEFIKKFMKRKTAVAGFIVIVFLVFLAIFGQYLAPYDPDAYDYSNTAFSDRPSDQKHQSRFPSLCLPV